MRAAALAVLLLAGCTGGSTATSSPAVPAATAAPATPTDSAATALPTASPATTPTPNTVYTAGDEEVAKLIKEGADEAIPQLLLLNDSDASKQAELFVPLGVWINGQKAGVQAYTPSSCTVAAAALFIEGMDLYDAIRKKFLAWRDWGGAGYAFSPAAPGQAVRTFEEALDELEAHCPA